MRDLHLQRQRLMRSAADQLNVIQRQMAALRAVAAGQAPAPGQLSGWQVPSPGEVASAVAMAAAANTGPPPPPPSWRPHQQVGVAHTGGMQSAPTQQQPLLPAPQQLRHERQPHHPQPQPPPPHAAQLPHSASAAQLHRMPRLANDKPSPPRLHRSSSAMQLPDAETPVTPLGEAMAQPEPPASQQAGQPVQQQQQQQRQEQPSSLQQQQSQERPRTAGDAAPAEGAPQQSRPAAEDADSSPVSHADGEQAAAELPGQPQQPSVSAKAAEQPAGAAPDATNSAQPSSKAASAAQQPAAAGEGGQKQPGTVATEATARQQPPAAAAQGQQPPAPATGDTPAGAASQLESQLGAAALPKQRAAWNDAAGAAHPARRAAVANPPAPAAGPPERLPAAAAQPASGSAVSRGAVSSEAPRAEASPAEAPPAAAGAKAPSRRPARQAPPLANSLHGGAPAAAPQQPAAAPRRAAQQQQQAVAPNAEGWFTPQQASQQPTAQAAKAPRATKPAVSTAAASGNPNRFSVCLRLAHLAVQRASRILHPSSYHLLLASLCLL